MLRVALYKLFLIGLQCVHVRAADNTLFDATNNLYSDTSGTFYGISNNPQLM